MFLDQTYWQRAIAVNYKSESSCFLTAGLAWFAIPVCIATVLGIGGLLLGIQVSDSTVIAPLMAYNIIPSSKHTAPVKNSQQYALQQKVTLRLPLVSREV